MRRRAVRSFRHENWKNASKPLPLANGYRNRRSQKSDGIFAADWYERNMAFPRPEDKEKREAWAHPLRGARV